MADIFGRKKISSLENRNRQLEEQVKRSGWFHKLNIPVLKIDGMEDVALIGSAEACAMVARHLEGKGLYIKIPPKPKGGN